MLTKEHRFIFRVLRSLPNTRRRLNPNVLRRIIHNSFANAPKERDNLLNIVGGEDGVIEAASPQQRSSRLLKPGPVSPLPEVFLASWKLLCIYLTITNIYSRWMCISTCWSCSTALTTNAQKVLPALISWWPRLQHITGEHWTCLPPVATSITPEPMKCPAILILSEGIIKINICLRIVFLIAKFVCNYLIAFCTAAYVRARCAKISRDRRSSSTACWETTCTTIFTIKCVYLSLIVIRSNRLV